MPAGTKRKKHHDKDKYYRLAKEQGFRSRAAFKLSQINRKFKILLPSSTKVVLDLCAAPGGWTQVIARTLPTSSTIILAVDILPIRPIGSNVITLIGDITTDKCRAEIKRSLQSAPVDVVLCDGAPNVGASYEKDAYVQNEIALHSLKCATEHLKPRGTFVTKLYRSRDYASYVWVAKQLFDRVEAVKPSSSRSQSAEIFLVCLGYKAPDVLDSRMLDPKCVFEFVENATDGGQMGGGVKGGGKMNIFHEKFFDKKRQRQGYDMTKLDFTMRSIGKVCDFMEGDVSAGIAILSDHTGLSFTCDQCSSAKQSSLKPDGQKMTFSCKCNFYKNHKLTTSEIKACLSDLKVLNRSDFKGILNWRLKILAEKDATKQNENDSPELIDDNEKMDEDNKEKDEEEQEQEIQDEITNLRLQKLREAKRKKKKEREIASKRRRRAAMSLDLTQDAVHESEQIFTLAQIQSSADLEAVREVDLADMEETDSEDELERAKKELDDLSSQGEDHGKDEDTGYSYRLDRELDSAYDEYLKKTKNSEAKRGTKMDKRAKKNRKEKIKNAAKEDAEIAEAVEGDLDEETKRYFNMLNGNKADKDDSDNEDEDDEAKDSDDGFDADPLTPEEHQAALQKKKDENPLIVKLPDEPTSVKAARWFSNPLFANIADVAKSAEKSQANKLAGVNKNHYDSDSSDDANADVESLSSDDEEIVPKKQTKKKEPPKKIDQGLTAEEILASIPRTDKQIRHERRLKSLARAERKKKRLAKLAGDEEDFHIIAGDNDDDDAEPSNTDKSKTEEQQALLKAGLGRIGEANNEKSGFDVVSSNYLPKVDTREYNSDTELYDSDDQAKTLALATMTLRHSRTKALVDASYNRYAWNDPSDLPDWFVDDESKHYRPQLPIPEALVQKMKERCMELAAKPMKKVAEARARKNKRARGKLAAAKKKAEAVAHSSDMTESMKLKAISKAMRGQDSKRPSKTYVVSKKNGSTKGGKGVKLVDKRMKNDKRSMDRSTKKRKNGKQGGLTGGKKRRHHK